ncbi:MAG: NEW3 domain-containing protein [Anaerolineales bacterium]
MKPLKILPKLAVLLVLGLVLLGPGAALAQEAQPTSPVPQPLTLYTAYPSRIIGIGEVVTIPLKLQAGEAQTVSLGAVDLPDGWDATFRGGGQLVDAVYVDGVNESSVDLRIDPTSAAEPGTYTLNVLASGKTEKSELPLQFTIKEKLPPRLSLAVDGLPTKRGAPDASFSFTATIKNEGGEDLLVALAATQPDNLAVTIQSAGQEVDELELAANESKTLTIKADPLISLEAGTYPFTVSATAGDVNAQLDLGIEVIGEGNLSITTPDGRLSGQANAGQENPIKVELANNGTAPLRGVELTSSGASGWSVTFDQPQIAEIPAGQSVEVTAQVKPPDKAVAGDYIVTINARPLDSKMESADFRITVRTSTLWGVAGLALIALSVGVVGIAVFRFGRR